MNHLVTAAVLDVFAHGDFSCCAQFIKNSPQIAIGAHDFSKSATEMHVHCPRRKPVESRGTKPPSPCRAVPAAAGAVGMLRAPGVDHRHDVTERASAVLALVGTALAAVVCNMLATARTVRMLGTPGVQQRTQRSVFRAAMDAHVLTALSTLVQSVFTLAGAAWMLRAPAIQQRPRIARRRSTVFAVFTHDFLPMNLLLQ